MNDENKQRVDHRKLSSQLQAHGVVKDGLRIARQKEARRLQISRGRVSSERSGEEMNFNQKANERALFDRLFNLNNIIYSQIHTIDRDDLLTSNNPQDFRGGRVTKEHAYRLPLSFFYNFFNGSCIGENQNPQSLNIDELINACQVHDLSLKNPDIDYIKLTICNNFKYKEPIVGRITNYWNFIHLVNYAISYQYYINVNLFNTHATDKQLGPINEMKLYYIMNFSPNTKNNK